MMFSRLCVINQLLVSAVSEYCLVLSYDYAVFQEQIPVVAFRIDSNLVCRCYSKCHIHQIVLSIPYICKKYYTFVKRLYSISDFN